MSKKCIICRFDNAEALSKFNEQNSLQLTSSTVSFDLDTNEEKVKKTCKTKTSTREKWKDEWLDMPEYVSEKQKVYAKIDFYFDEETKLEKLCEIFSQNITDKTKSVWFPKLITGTHSKHRVLGGSSNTRYPIYVVSKGRSQNCYTSRFLTQMEVKHYIVVEPQEVEEYRKYNTNDYATLLVMDMNYKEKYDTFDELGDSKSKGPGAARNFCWDDSINRGYKWHWVFDDNTTEGFHYMNHNRKIKCRTGAFFGAIEDFVDRYTNIAIAGLNYSKFCKESDKTPAYVMNTRIYSFLLIRNDIPYRWRGRYNEDTDLSLRVLKDGWCTIQFNAFLAGKATTQTVSGGNTEEFYKNEGTYNKSKMLEDMHPDVAKLVWKFNRWHHQVDYSGFKQELIRKENIHIPNKINNYGMFIISTEETETNDSRSYLEEKYLLKEKAV